MQSSWIEICRRCCIRRINILKTKRGSSRRLAQKQDQRSVIRANGWSKISARAERRGNGQAATLVPDLVGSFSIVHERGLITVTSCHCLRAAASRHTADSTSSILSLTIGTYCSVNSIFFFHFLQFFFLLFSLLISYIRRSVELARVLLDRTYVKFEGCETSVHSRYERLKFRRIGIFGDERRLETVKSKGCNFEKN